MGFIQKFTFMSVSSPETKIDLKNPILAAVLGFLIPGAGHFYQGRTFKGIIYCVCILAMFACGMQMGNWQLIYRKEPAKIFDFDFDDARFRQLDPERFDDMRQQLDQMGTTRARGKTEWGYYAQAPVGLFTIPAFIQEERYYQPSNEPISPESKTINQEIVGNLDYVNDEGKEFSLPVSGTIQLSPEDGEFGREMEGTFSGKGDNGEIEVSLRGNVRMDPPVGANHYRNLRINAITLGDEQIIDGVLTAQVKRSFLNWFLVPPDHEALEQLHSDLGKKFTLAKVFTWIAGLLNILAIWDAYAGPAYGYRMPTRKEESPEKKPERPSVPEASPSSTTSQNPG